VARRASRAMRAIKFGSTNTRVYRNADDENDLLMMLDIAYEARARELVKVVRKMQSCGRDHVYGLD
jgi:hypothetical protein